MAIFNSYVSYVKLPEGISNGSHGSSAAVAPCSNRSVGTSGESAHGCARSKLFDLGDSRRLPETFVKSQETASKKKEIIGNI